MSEYLDGLGADANVGQVFHDLHGRARALVEELDALREAEYGSETSLADMTAAVPGIELEVTSSRVWPVGGYYLARHVNARSEDGEGARLFATTAYHHGSEGNPEPTRVTGNRGNEVSGDYSMAQRSTEEPDPGLVVAWLRALGVSVEAGEPLGNTEREPATLITDLTDEDLERFAIVSQGILDNLTVAELIRDGAPADEALATMDRMAVKL